MKKVSILISSLATGGAERVVSNLLKELNSKYDITLVLLDKTINYNLPSNQKVVYLDENDLKQNMFFKLIKLPIVSYKYKNFCKDNDIEVSLSFMDRPNYINILSTLLGNKARVIISERIISSLEYSTNGIKDLLSRFMIKVLYPKADLILPNSHGIKYDLINNFNIDENKIEVINNPIDIKYIEKLSTESLILNNDKFKFITVGRLHSQKNHKLLLDAMKDIDAVLYIVGEGVLKQELLNYAKRLKVDDKIFFLGNQKNPFKYLTKTDCFLLGSDYEGFPNVLLEALACKLPVVSTDCQSGPREILSANNIINKKLSGIEFCEYGMLVEVNNKYHFNELLEYIVKNQNILRNYQDKSYARACEFDIEKIIQKYIDLL